MRKQVTDVVLRLSDLGLPSHPLTEDQWRVIRPRSARLNFDARKAMALMTGWYALFIAMAVLELAALVVADHIAPGHSAQLFRVAFAPVNFCVSAALYQSLKYFVALGAASLRDRRASDNSDGPRWLLRLTHASDVDLVVPLIVTVGAMLIAFARL